jgi:hypothetical protein
MKGNEVDTVKRVDIPVGTHLKACWPDNKEKIIMTENPKYYIFKIAPKN